MRKWTSLTNNKGIKTRFLTTLCVNIIRVGLGFVTGLIIAKVLGPADYGNYNFLLGSFVSITALLDMGTSSAFYTFLSQRKHSINFYFYYLSWIGIQFIIILLLISVIFPETWRNKIWLDHTKGIIILAFLASFMMNKIWQTVSQAGESNRATVIVQLHNIFISVLYLCVVIAVALFHRLTISNLFTVIVFTYLLLSFILAKKLKDNLIGREGVKLRNVVNEFKTYCTPLIIYGVVSFAYSFADVWLLQRFGGAVQQGFYFVGFRFSAICLIATTSMLKVFWKEIAEADKLGNEERLYYLYIKMSRGLCFVSAIGACFLIPFSKEIIVFFLGPKYEAGWICLAIMFLYPIHQSIGQISVSYFYATTQTKLYSKIMVIMMIVSIVVTYFVLASNTAIIPGFELGSVGLALKMVIFQIISVNILAHFICKQSGWRSSFLYQFGTIGFLLAASFTTKVLLNYIFHISKISFPPLVLIVFCIPIYISIVGLIIYSSPQLCGLERKQVTDSIQYLHRFLKIK